MQQDPKSNQELFYDIVQQSGQEKDYTVEEIKKSQYKSKGWQSQRFCEYPQEIVLKMKEMSQIRQIEFLSHQSKISQKVEIYICNETNQPVERLRFKKLGYLQFDDNQRSNYQSRELKSVYIDNRCLYMKLIFHKCHMNKYNLFNQIGLISLQLTGQVLPQPQQQHQQQQQQQYNFHNPNNHSNNPLQQQLKNLQMQKAKAIQAEDFDQAQQLKDQIDKLQSNNNQLNYLEEKKQIAVNNEDYESAQIIKKEIEKIKLQFQNFANKQHQNQANQQNQMYNMNQKQSQQSQRNNYNQNYNQNQYNDQYYTNNYQNYNNQNINQPYNFQSSNINRPNNNEFDQNNQSHQEPQYNNRQTQQNNRQQVQEEGEEDIDNLKNKYKKRLKDKQQNNNNKNNESEVRRDQNMRMSQPIRGMKKEEEGQQMYEQENGEMVESVQLEDLSEKQREECLDIIQELGEDTCQRLFCKQFKVREGVGQLKGLTGRPALRVVQILLGDRVVSVVVQGLSLWLRLLARQYKLYQPLTTQLITILVDKLGDNNSKIREQSEQVVEQLGRLEEGGGLLVEQLVQPSSRQLKNIKHLVHRLKCLASVLPLVSTSWAEEALVLARQALDNSNNDVRQAALLLLQAIYHLDPTINLSSIKQVHLDQLDLSNQPKKPLKQSQPQYKQNKNTSQRQEYSGDKSECEFCLQSRVEWRDDQMYDQHLVRECRLVRECGECQKSVALEEWRVHLLQECKNITHQECPRCQQPIDSYDYQQHTQQATCTPYTPHSLLCPLCHTTISDLRQHILSDMCPISL